MIVHYIFCFFEGNVCISILNTAYIRGLLLVLGSCFIRYVDLLSVYKIIESVDQHKTLILLFYLYLKKKKRKEKMNSTFFAAFCCICKIKASFSPVFFDSVPGTTLRRICIIDKHCNCWAGVSSEENLDNRAAVKEALVIAYKTHIQDRMGNELQECHNQIKEDEPEKWTNQWSTTWSEQFRVLLERGLKERRHESFSGLKIAQILVVALVSGILWWQSGGHVQDQVNYGYKYPLAYTHTYIALQTVY